MSFKVHILGANSSLPAYGRHHTSQVVEIESSHFLVDCGEGTQYQIQKYNIKASRIDHIFVSHLHGDHFLGLMGVIYSYHLSGREKTLHVYGQRGLQDIITTQLKWSYSTLNFELRFHELNHQESELIFENKHAEIHSFPLNHRIPTCGFLFREKPKPRRINAEAVPEDFPKVYFNLLKAGKDIVDEDGSIRYHNKDLTYDPKPSRSYAFCSDTCYDESIIDHIKGVDLLYHETTFLNEMKNWAIKTYHSTTGDAAEIALKAKVGRLMIGHYSARYKETEVFVNECLELFSETFAAIEGETVILEE